METDRGIIRLGGICGIVGTVLYIALALSDPYVVPRVRTLAEILAAWGGSGHGHINTAIHFLAAAVGTLWLVAFLGLQRLLDGAQPRLGTRIATLFGIIACAIWVAMVIVQGTVMVEMGRAILRTATDPERLTALGLYQGLRYVDYGLDLAFDWFLIPAWLLLGWRMLGHASFGRVFGAVGIGLVALIALFNLVSAPDPPKLELSPLVSLWALAVYVQMVRSTRLAGEAAAGNRR